MPVRHVYHWKHGWIPLTHAAALSKAHHSHTGAARVAKRYGIPDEGGHHGSGDGLPPVPAGGHFRMAGGDLEKRAKAGDALAQAELDRRAARRKAAGGKFGGKKADVPFRPGAGERTPPRAPKAPDVPKREEPKPPAPKLTPEVPKREHPKPPEPPKLTPEVPKREEPKPPDLAPHVPTTEDEWKAHHEAENARIAPDGYTIRSNSLNNAYSSAPLSANPRFLHRQYKGVDSVGYVVEERSGGYRATGYKATRGGKSRTNVDLGTFANRADAHRAIAEHDRNMSAAAERKREAEAKKAAKNAGVGGWEVNNDPTRPASIKQSFKLGNTTVHIESAMSAATTRAFLADVKAVMEKSGMDQNAVTVHVPVGDRVFRSRSGIVGGYVHSGTGRTVYLNPKVAGGDLAESYGERAGRSGEFMPARQLTNGRQYVLAHELGHVHDNIHQHTSRQFSSTPSGFQIPGDRPRAAIELARANADHLSRYGRTNLAESYAEAFVQWVHGGAGSNKASDAFAAHFGWRQPR